MKTRHPLSKRLMAGFLGIGATFALAACGQPDGIGTEPTPEDPAATQPGETDDPTAAQPDMPAEDPMAAEGGDSIVDVAASDDSFSILVEAMQATGLDQPLATDGPFTVFAPTNEAFEALPDGTLETLLQPENQEILAQILSYHVVPQEVAAADVTTGEVPTAAGQTLSVMVDEATGEVMVNEATVIQTDIQADNGVIHAIDQVILPPGLEI
jgi:uncharacterized surface protein with fasciclin (FAS1) repeats